MTTYTQVEAKSTSTPIPAMPPTHSGLLPQQEQEEPDHSLLPAEDRLRSPNPPTPPPINPSVGHNFGTMAIGPTTSSVLQRMAIIQYDRRSCSAITGWNYAGAIRTTGDQELRQLPAIVGADYKKGAIAPRRSDAALAGMFSDATLVTPFGNTPCPFGIASYQSP